jgi:Protein of unknown function (DUF4238)
VLNKPRVRRSHVVPKFYLRGFCEADTERVWVGDIRTQKIYHAHIAKIAVVKDFYVAENGENEDDLEERLSRIESNAAPELRGFLAGKSEISPDLGRLIAWLAARTVWLRRVTQETFPAYLQANREALRKFAGSEKRPFEFERLSFGDREQITLIEALERINDPAWRICVTQDQHLDVIRLQAHLFRAERFPNMKWVRATAPSGYHFVTSDRPVCWDVLGAGVSDSPAALRHPLAELTVALDAGHALVANHDSTGVLTRSWNVAEINERICAGTERFIYGPRREDVSSLLAHRQGQRLH